MRPTPRAGFHTLRSVRRETFHGTLQGEDIRILENIFDGARSDVPAEVRREDLKLDFWPPGILTANSYRGRKRSITWSILALTGLASLQLSVLRSLPRSYTSNVDSPTNCMRHYNLLAPEIGASAYLVSP